MSSGEISSNPSSVSEVTGTGKLQQYINEKFGIKDTQGIRIGGMYIGDTNDLFSGGIPDPQRQTSNSLLLLNLSIDTEKFKGWQGGLFNVEFLQFNGQRTNTEAGSIQSYNGLPGLPPLNRSELYQLWYRQSLFQDKVILRIGKSIPTYDFTNVIRSIHTRNEKTLISATTGLIYTPIFVNSSLLGVLPGYYNSAYGITLNFAPIKTWYTSLGVYDGSLARNIQTGLTGPHFNGSYFNIVETGAVWVLGKNQLPGKFSVGVWHQTGPVINSMPYLSEQGASGIYLFGSQRLWYNDPKISNKGLTIFYQYGRNNSSVLPITQFIGSGFTFFEPITNRKDDSFGFGLAYAWLQQNLFIHNVEIIYQTYYQAKVYKEIYLEPALSYIPKPGTSNNPDWAATLRAIILF